MLLLKLFSRFFKNHLIFYPTPSNLSYFWGFGSVLGLFLSIQIISGIFLSMHYCADPGYAFSSVEHIMRNVNFGWLFRYTHANGASLILFLLYCHMGRSVYYRSYAGARTSLWLSGLLLFLLVMLTAFVGYVLPWGQMSFWAATVITNLLSAIPVFGKKAAFWVWGGQGVAKATLSRFYTFHFFVPFVILGISFIHISLLHTEGSSEPLSLWDINDFLRFYPYFYLKDCFGLFLTCFLFSIFVFFYPNLLMHPDNYIPANALVTPAHIVPEWYFLPFYATLRAVPSKLGGVFIMGSFIGALAILPLLDPVNALRCPEYCPVYRLMFWFWVSGFLLLGYLGSMPVSYPFVFLSRFFVSYHFFFLLIYTPAANGLQGRGLANLMVWVAPLDWFLIPDNLDLFLWGLVVLVVFY